MLKSFYVTYRTAYVLINSTDVRSLHLTFHVGIIS